ncbi:hypothetical protein BDK63_002046 [Halomonas campaniensis]|uniref:Uncharacterized protein n=1 Tax=Halomonas campaniensis TaxID=213554 RepID=A0A7W5K3D6_9GAMM|nr:hypothetical protein [Halomonas campaniensis]MBB3331164.1 hypothetical protein [Halomonas campaniensis]
MKINVEFDLTPEEFRQALGLPDVEAFQRDLLERIQKQMESGVEGYDPMSLMQPFLQQSGLPQGLTQGLSQGLSSFGSYQQMMLDMLRQAGQGATQAASSEAKASRDSASSSGASSGKGSAGTGAAKAGSARKSTASARSRTKRES